MKVASRAALFALTLLAACENGNDPTMASVAGAWQASVLTTTEGNTTTNQLQQGAALTLILNASGSVTGALVVPSENVNESMAGTWFLNGNTVTFSQAADTFVRDMAFTFQNNTLVGDQTFGGVRVQVTLVRAGVA